MRDSGPGSSWYQVGITSGVSGVCHSPLHIFIITAYCMFVIIWCRSISQIFTKGSERQKLDTKLGLNKLETSVECPTQ